MNARENRGPQNKGAETKALVDAAEAVMTDAFRGGLDRGKLSKSQMSQLVGVCQEAACHEEVANYLRYQAGRADPSWTLALTEQVIGGIDGVFSTFDVDADAHPERMQRWRRYATFLARSFTYHDAARRAGERGAK